MSAPPAAAAAETVATARTSTPGKRTSSGGQPAVEGSFLTRVQQHVEQKEHRAAQAAAETAFSFVPQLATDPAKLLQASPRLKGRLSETKEERFRRLSVTEAQEREDARKGECAH